MLDSNFVAGMLTASVLTALTVVCIKYDKADDCTKLIDDLPRTYECRAYIEATVISKGKVTHVIVNGELKNVN